ncbi:MAG: family protein phosphatase [Thermoplasmata archaeon]|jgi:serine/threonine protein phosphatase PrpC|nr:family protein phosphatase [Thermoplasmata archaeon]
MGPRLTLPTMTGWEVAVLHELGGRTSQQDAWACLPATPFAGATADVFAVFDGLGGLPRGADAADACAKGLAAVLQACPSLERAMQALDAAARATGGATTATLLAVAPDGRGQVATVGDSSAYHLRDGLLDLLVPGGRAATGAVTSALGRGGAPRLASFTAKPGDTVAAATDGVGDFFAPLHLERLLARAPAEAAQAAWAEVRRRGAPDNATLVVARRA